MNRAAWIDGQMGARFGMLVVSGIEIVPRGRWREKCARVTCDCGSSVVVLAQNLKCGRTRSCGCNIATANRKAATKHGFTKFPEYSIWRLMIQRCTNPDDPRYKDYGGRGIAVCERWLKFENFLTDMGRRPDGMSLDRRNNDMGYEPGNCRWATSVTQANNTRRNRLVEYRGEILSITQWARRFGINARTLATRIAVGTPLELAMTCEKFQGRRSGTSAASCSK